MESLPIETVTWGGGGYPTYEGLLKGDASKAEQGAADSLRQQELNLMQQQLQMVNPTIQSIIQNGGMLPQQQAAMTSLALNQLPADFNRAIGDVQNNLMARGITGGGMAGSGDVGRNFGSLYAFEDALKQNALSNIQLAKGQGLNQALGMGLGLTNMFNTGAGSALGHGVTAAGNVDQAQSAFWGSLIGAGASLGSAAMGG
jgi:hypothetical protein